MNKYKNLLEQIDNIGGAKSYKTSVHPQNPWNKAFDLYNKENKRPLRRGCGSCNTKVYNWLKRNA